MRAEILWVLTNLITCGTHQDNEQVFENHEGIIIKILLEALLVFNNNKLAVNILESLMTLLKLDEIYQI